MVAAWLVLWALVGVFLWQEHQVATNMAKAFSRHLAFVFGELVEQSLTVNRLVVDSMLDWLSEEDVATEADFRRVAANRQFHDRLRERTANLSQIEVATFIALDGTVLNFTRNYPPPPIDLSDRDYFQEQVRPGAPPLSLGNVVQNRGTGAWTFYLAKAVRGPSGDKLGVAIVGVRASYYSDLFRQVMGQSGEQAFLVRNDGILLATSSGSPAALGSQVATPQQLRDALVNRSDATVDFPGLPGLGAASAGASSISRLEAFPAFVVATADKVADPASWFRKLTFLVSGGVVLSFVILGIGWRNYHLLEATDRALRQEGERRILSAIFGSPLALAALVDNKRRILYRNAEFAAHLQDFVRDDALVLGSDVEGASVFAGFLGSDHASVEFTLRPPSKDGRQISLRFTGARVDLGEAGGAVALVGYDDTRRVEADARIIQSSKLITLGEMATSMAHELNQPLNVIKMAGQSALFEIEDFVPPGAATGAAALPPILPFLELKLQRVVEQVDRAAAIIDHMRIFGRVPRGLPPVIDVSTVCRAALQLLVHQLRETQIAVDTDFGDRPLLVTCHPILLEQVLINLMLNARDALIEAGTVAPELRIAATRTGQEVVVVVSDNGLGIPPEFRDRVFQPFFTTKPADKGTGLGLAVSYGIVRDSGGRLELLNEGSGCAFRISLPAARAEAAAAS